MTIAEYFERPDAQRVLLVDIQRSDASTTCYRLSDAYYVTEAGDTPPSLSYAPVIQELPEFRRTLSEPFDGEASTGYGTFRIADADVSYTASGGHGTGDIALRRGSAITVKMAAPRHLFPLSDAVPLASLKVRRIGGSSDGSITFEAIDRTQEIADKAITIDTAVGPQTWGYARNMTPFLTAPATLKYAVHTGAVEDIVEVYDQGVALGSGVGFTKNNAAGTFVLASSPAGVVTADVKGGKVGGVWLDSTAEIITQLLSNAGVSITTNINLPTGVVGIVISESTTLGEVLTQLCRGCAGYWLIDRTGELVAAQYPVPAGGGTTFDDLSLSEASFEDVDRLYDKVRYAYRKNWTQYQALPAATTAQATFAASQGIENELTGTPADTELDHETSPLFQTYFDAQADAQAVAQRLLDIYLSPRKLITTTVPYSEALDIGTAVTLGFDGQSFNGAVVSVVDRFGQQYPIQQITVIA